MIYKSHHILGGKEFHFNVPGEDKIKCRVFDQIIRSLLHHKTQIKTKSEQLIETNCETSFIEKKHERFQNKTT